MPQYIRAFVAGGTFFFTVTLLQRRQKLFTENERGIYNLKWAADDNVQSLEME